MEIKAITRTARPILLLILLIWVVEIINQLSGHRLNTVLGLEPRSVQGLVGIAAMPLLHSGFDHAAANTAPLVVLGLIGSAVAPQRFWQATLLIVALSGLGVWLLARSGIIVGASGLVFGWFGFLVALGVLERSLRTILGALIVLVLYGGMIWGILPEKTSRISWEAHLFGAAAGAGIAYAFRKRSRKSPG